MAKIEKHYLKVGEFVALGHLMTKLRITYAGMPTDRTFSLAVISAGPLAYNLFFSKEQREIKLGNGLLIVHEVLPEKIHFDYHS